MKGLTFGADVEFFIQHPDYMYCQPACGLFGGTKEEPIQFPDEREGFMYQEDGCALELNVPIATSVSEFGENIKRMVQLGHALVESKIKKATLNEGTVIYYVREENHTNKKDVHLEYYGPPLSREKHPNAFVVGCSPDWDAYLLAERPLLQIEELGNQRYSGGHIHVGYDVSACPRELFIRCMDSYLAPVMKDMALNISGCMDRFKFYGSPGVYRPKEYGVEYRSLGGTWPISHFKGVMAALTRMEKDWTESRDKFYERGMNIKPVAKQIYTITGQYQIPRGHTAESAGVPKQHRIGNQGW